MSASRGAAAERLAFEGLLLRAYVETDGDAFVDAVRESAASVGRWMTWAHAGYSSDEAIAWFEACRAHRVAGTAYEYGLFDADDGRFLGGAGLNGIDRAQRLCNLGYWCGRRRSVAASHRAPFARCLPRPSMSSACDASRSSWRSAT